MRANDNGANLNSGGNGSKLNNRASIASQAKLSQPLLANGGTNGRDTARQLRA
jgi:hypothetical protein